MASKNFLEVLSKASDMVVSDPISAVKAIDTAVKAMDSFDERVDFIGASAVQGRAQWVQTAIVVARAFDGLSRKEMAAKVEQFKTRLNYGRAHVYNYRKAGDKLLAMAEQGTLKDIPFSLVDFLASEKAEKVTKQSIKSCVKAGEYLTADKEKIIIYRGELTMSDGKKGFKYFTIPAGGAYKDGFTVTVQQEGKPRKDGTIDKDKEIDVCYIEGKPVDLTVVNL